ncbi:MAG: phosphate signaling complex protein PhoU [Verrucomicrobiota bacterium]|nr:phosphate signaling complex protein PhoU [Verrucomicrobiota bacterium]
MATELPYSENGTSTPAPVTQTRFVGSGKTDSHYEATMERDLDRIRSAIGRMADLACHALRDCVKALQERNRQLAYAVIIRDQNIDELEKEIDRLCLEFLVRQQPVARPLRFAYTALKVNTELERVGDYAESIAHQGAKLITLGVPVPVERFSRIADRAIGMLSDAVRAYLSADHALALATIPTEDIVDVQKSELRKELIRMYKDDLLPFEALDPCLTITRRLERVSDQARNICAETIYLSTGEFSKHREADTFRILFIDRYNAGVSLMAEAIGESLRKTRFIFASAGLEPKAPSDTVLEFMKEKGFDLSHKRSKAINQVPELDRYHVVIALDPDAKRLFPRQTHKIIFLDWAVEDPAAIDGPPPVVRAACENAFRVVDEQLRALIDAVMVETGD